MSEIIYWFKINFVKFVPNTNNDQFYLFSERYMFNFYERCLNIIDVGINTCLYIQTNYNLSNWIFYSRNLNLDLPNPINLLVHCFCLEIIAPVTLILCALLES